MRLVLPVIILFSFLLSACQPAAVPVSGGEMPASESTLVLASATPAAAIPATHTPQPPASTSAPAPTETAQPTPTATPSPVGIIRVDTLEQEIYPFEQNGNCSLAEAISAANLLQPVDGCAAGVEDQTVIELMPGTYKLSQRDATPQQIAWAVHTSPVGNALPAIGRSLTLRGNGAVLSREGASQPFRILEVLYGTFNLENITLQGGDAGPDGWGGALLVEHASANLESVQFLNNKAENGAGMYFFFAGLSVKNSLFSGNEATGSGGGLDIRDARAQITQTRFLENRADGSGAGLHADRVTLMLSDSIFIGNINTGPWGGGLSISEVNATLLRDQFYRNVAGSLGGGVAFRNYIYDEDIAEAEANPLDAIQQSSTYTQLATTIPGFQATLEADPSGRFQAIKLEIQIHDSCFQGNVTHFPGDPNWTSAISGVSFAQNNYYGDASGPGGMGPGTGDMVGKMIEFEPFLTAPPAHCDLSLAKK